MNLRLLWAVVALMATVGLVSCEAPYVGPASEAEQDETCNVVIRTSIYEQSAFESLHSRAAQEISELCTRIGFAVFKDGEKVKTINQTKSTAGFGSAEFSLSEGQYELVIIAHNCDGNATITSAEKITFPNNIVSDTFYYYGTFSVGDDKTELNLMLERAVAMVRVNITTEMPADVSQMKFYYTGGSSTFSAREGYGCVNSKQTVKMNVTADMHGKPTTWELYTLPHAESGVLKLTISALDAAGNTLYEKELEDVPVTVNAITTYTGDLFDLDPQDVDTKAFHLMADGAWDEGPNETF